MFSYGNYKSFITKIIVGTIFIIISGFLAISLITYSYEDPGLGNAGKNLYILNLGGVYGAYTASILFRMLSLSSSLLVLFFFIHGVKIILGIQNNYFYLKFFIFLLSLAMLNLGLSMIGYNSGLIGDILLNLVFGSSYIEFKLSWYFWFVFFLILFFSIFLIISSLGVKVRSIQKIILFFLSFLIIIKKIFIFLKPSRSPKKNLTEKNIKKNNYIKKLKRVDPTITKRSITTNLTSNLQKNRSSSESLEYILPSINLLKTSDEYSKSNKNTNKLNTEFSKKLEEVLAEYGVEGQIVNFRAGPVVTLYEFLPAAGVKTSKVVGLSEDIARAMSSISARISSQPGKTSIGIEIPNQNREGVLLGDLIKDNKFTNSIDGLTLAIGKNISGEKIFTNLEKMPHLLIAGTTGSGKSVGLNSMIISLLYKFTPSQCKLILIDPKMLELSIYEEIPHLLTPVVTDPNKAIFALKWVVREMENRYRLMSSLNVKNISSFNTKILKTLAAGKKLYREVQTGVDAESRMPIIEKREIPLDEMPLIVVVIDEMADLMMVAGKEVENLVQRLAQMARASGIHLIAATQRPSVDVITGTIKANFPSRISFRVASRFDSRTIINEMGAEQLLGSGDMLFLENGASLNRLHGGFISEEEISAVVNHINSQKISEIKTDINLDVSNTIEKTFDLGLDNKGDVDELYQKALNIILEQQKVSTSFIQRYLQIGYNRAARIVEKMEEEGYISEPNNAGKRSVLKKNK